MAANKKTSVKRTTGNAKPTAARAKKAEWSPLTALCEALSDPECAGTLGELPERHFQSLKQRMEKYITALVKEDSADRRAAHLDEVEQRLGDFGIAHGEGGRWVTAVIALAASRERVAARNKAEVVARWECFEQLSQRVRADASATGSSASTADEFAQDVAENVQAITSVLFALSERTDTEQALANVVEAVRTVFFWDYGAHWEVNGSTLRCLSQQGELGQELVLNAKGYEPGPGEGPLGLAWAAGDVVWRSVDEMGSSSRAAVAKNAGALFSVCVPIRIDEQVSSVLEFMFRSPAPLSQAREDMLRNLSVLVSASVDRMVRVQQMEAMAADAEAVSQVLHRLNGAANAGSAVAGALAAVCEAFGFRHASHSRVDAGGRLHSTAHYGEAFARFAADSVAMERTTKDGLAAKVSAERSLVVLQDLRESDDPRRELAKSHGLAGALGIPLVSKNEVIGTLEFFSSEPLHLPEGRMQALTSVAGAVSYTVERLLERDAFSRSLTEFAQELTGVSGALRATTSEQSASAQELASAVGEVTATLSELRETSAEALRNAEAVIGQAEGAALTSSSGRESVEHAIRSMRAIQEQVTEIAERILQLSDQTSQIGNIIATVNEISAQSKLLALNASIEAARAGEHGKGFGVVASEIRSLAEQSREATGQVREILGEIQGGTNAAVVSAEEGTKKAESGMQLAEVSGDKIQDLAESIEQSSASARLIANSSRQQNAGIEQVTQALVSISNATNSTASGLKQTEQATAQLVQLADRMSELVRGLANQSSVDSVNPDATQAAQ